VRLFKRCTCVDRKACRHPFWFACKLYQHKHSGSTRTANYRLAERIAARYRNDVLAGKAGLTRKPPVRFSEHIKAYVAHTEKTNRSSYKDAAVLQRLLESVGDRPITEVSSFHLERWKRERAAEVSRSTVNRELNIIRGCFSRAVEWDRLSLSPMRRIKAYRVDDVRLRVCTPAEIKTLLESTPDETKSTRKPRLGAVALADLACWPA
jgi:hypothetical protein